MKPASIPMETLVIYGYNTNFRINGGKLKIRYGFPANGDVQEAVIERGTNRIDHVVILGQSGTLSLDVIHWFMNQEIAVSVLDEYGNLLTSFMPEKHISPIVKRRQATSSLELNMKISTEILSKKLEEQRKTLSYLQRTYGQVLWWTGEREAKFKQTHHIVTTREQMLSSCLDIESQRILEAQAASAYWQCFEGIPLSWKQIKKIPQNWQSIRNRTSPKTGSPRKAVDPFNASLNYCYAVLETLVKQECLKAGIDPDFGIIHADHANRTSLVFDLMEPIRPKVDKLLLNWVLLQRFNPKDFYETREGICKVGTEITKQIIPLVKGLQKDIVVVVRDFASYFKNKCVSQKPENILPVKKHTTKPNTSKQLSMSFAAALNQSVLPDIGRQKSEVDCVITPAESIVNSSKEKACLECSLKFIPRSVKQNFCCDRHKNTYWKRLRRKKRIASGHCPQCGQPMPKPAGGTYKEILTYCLKCVDYFKQKHRQKTLPC